MVQSLNKTVDIVVDATSFMGFADYGQVMVGDAGFEFYNTRDLNRYIQIPWTEIEYVKVSLLFGGRYIPRIAIKIKHGGTFTFSMKQSKAVLRAMNQHLARSQFTTARSLWQIVVASVRDLVKAKSK